MMLHTRVSRAGTGLCENSTGSTALWEPPQLDLGVHCSWQTLLEPLQRVYRPQHALRRRGSEYCCGWAPSYPWLIE